MGLGATDVGSEDGAPVDVGADEDAGDDAGDDVDAVLVEDAWDWEAVAGEAGVAWEGGEVEVDPDPEPPGSSAPPQAASAVIAAIANAMRGKRV